MKTSLSSSHEWPFPSDAMRLSRIAKSKGLAVAVEGGLFQVQRVTYRKGGKATIHPITGWVSVEAALEAVK